MDESEESLCMDARRTEACIAPRHVDTSRDFILFYPNEQRRVEGAALPDVLFCSLFSVQQTTNGVGCRVKYW